MFNNRRSSLDCLVRDISDQGAKLKFSEAIAVPDVIELLIPSKNETYRARVRWRVGEEVGVAFETDVAKPAQASPEPDASTAPRDLLGRVAHLEAEVASLHRKVNDLLNERRKRQNDD
jgi:uncharacterized protein YceH (UPF0502 family)